MSFLKNLFGGAKKAVATLRTELLGTEKRLSADMAAMEARLKVAFDQAVREAIADAPAILADVAKAAEGQPKA